MKKLKLEDYRSAGKKNWSARVLAGSRCFQNSRCERTLRSIRQPAHPKVSPATRTLVSASPPRVALSVFRPVFRPVFRCPALERIQPILDRIQTTGLLFSAAGPSGTRFFWAFLFPAFPDRLREPP